MNLMKNGKMPSTVDSLLLLFLDLEKVLDELKKINFICKVNIIFISK